MNYIFDEQERIKARSIKKIMLFSYLLLFAIFLTAVLLIAFVPSRDVSRRFHILFVIINASITIVFLCFSLFFYVLKFKPIRFYVRMFRDMDSGLQDEATGIFVEYDKSITTKDGLSFYSLVLDAVPLRRDDISIRKVLIEKSRPKPDLITGERVKVITHANILVAWEKA